MGLTLSLKDGSIYDELKRKQFEGSEVSIYFILYGYVNARPIPETTKLISFRQLSGGQVYYKAFMERAIHPIIEVFGSNPLTLIEAAKLLGGTPQTVGEYAVKIYSLPLVPLTVILWAKTTEFPASANILFDSNANNYLSTEELSTLGGLTSARLRHALEVMKKI